MNTATLKLEGFDNQTISVRRVLRVLWVYRVKGLQPYELYELNKPNRLEPRLPALRPRLTTGLPFRPSSEITPRFAPVSHLLHVPLEQGSRICLCLMPLPTKSKRPPFLRRPSVTLRTDNLLQLLNLTLHVNLMASFSYGISPLFQTLPGIF